MSNDLIKIPYLVWKKLTPQEYADQYKSFGKHVAISQETVEGCQEVWVYLGDCVQFKE